MLIRGIGVVVQCQPEAPFILFTVGINGRRRHDVTAIGLDVGPGDLLDHVLDLAARVREVMVEFLVDVALVVFDRKRF